MSDWDRALIWVVLCVAMSRTYDSGSFVWWFWSAAFLFWVLVAIVLLVKDVASRVKERRRA